ncbi:Phytanoyl-CoA dioxygenase [Gracilariopsis chorda]|uniref:Phytanoyl-CoA dioxygenase n=1 Tax=Gracilariopsis chorda TaxID=448386 RepID=A0A2V3IHR9_9FLOR|nr:Phytanoyl-CoA dioxygenase [Gracilariopsis chorda]|eukprot:PXF41655.1 Phytanoyl-CoA dioxygenase [Gracilariopsis chorda]
MEGYFDWSAEDPSACLEAAKSFFEAHGYAVLRAHASEKDVKTLREGAKAIIQEFYSNRQHASVFSTDEQTRVVEDDYFLSSSRKICCFLEPEQESEQKARPAINKIGHALHDIDDNFKPFSRSGAVRAVAKAFGFEKALLVQSMYILKNARVGAAVNAHRDAAFVHAGDGMAGSCLGFWWALEDATEENGCLWAVSGSHRDGAAIRRMVCRDGRNSFVGEDEMEYDDQKFVALPMKAGDVILLHGGLVHRSLPNRSEKSRHAYSIHVVRDAIGEECWLNWAGGEPFRPV